MRRRSAASCAGTSFFRSNVSPWFARSPFIRLVTQQVQESLEIQPIRLGAPPAAVHLEARRVDHEILDPVRDQKPMQPESIPAGFVQTYHPSLSRKRELPLRPLDRREQSLPIARNHLASENLPSKASDEAQRPSPSSSARQSVSSSAVVSKLRVVAVIVYSSVE